MPTLLTEEEKERCRYHTGYMRTCRQCGFPKALDLFCRDKRMPFGRTYLCKECEANRARSRYDADPVGRLAQNAQWKSRNIEKFRAYDNQQKKRRYYLRRLGLTPEQRDALLAKPCHYCFGEATEIDHKVAVSRGGTSTLDNLVPACRSCNARKSARPYEEWI